MLQKNQRPDIAVLLPLYYGNVLNEVRLSVRSLLRQSVSCDIFIGIDGPLTPELYDYLCYLDVKYPTKIFLVSSQSNIGLANILNQCLDKALSIHCYKFLARMDGDDFCVKDRFKIQIDYLASNSNIVAVGSNIVTFYKKTKKRQISYVSDYDKIKNKFIYQSPIAHPSVMFRSSVLKRFRYNPTYWLNEDYKLWSDILLSGYNISNIPLPLLYFRFSPATYSRRSGFKVSFSELKIRLHYLFSSKSLNPLHYLLCFLFFLSKLSPNFLLSLQYSVYRYFLNFFNSGK